MLEVRNQEGGKYIFMALIFDPLISVGDTDSLHTDMTFCIVF